MNIKRFGILGVSIVSGVAAFVLISSRPPVVVQAEAPAPLAPHVPSIVNSGPAMVDLLVATRDLPVGSKLSRSDFRWAQAVVGAHPVDAVLRKGDGQDAQIEAEIVDSVIRQSLLAGEALNRRRLVKPGGGGYLAYTLPPGKRAVAVDIDVRGNRSAGNFVMPDDRVDILATELGSGPGLAKPAATLIRDIRVLAVGQQLAPNPEGGTIIVGETITLEVDPAQAEQLAGAMPGTLKLSLRPHGEKAEQVAITNNQIMTVRYGIARQQ